MRVRLAGTVLLVSLVTAPAPAVAASTAPPTVVVSATMVHSGDTVRVAPSSPCVPPSAAQNPIARVGVATQGGDVVAVADVDVPIGPDGTWSESRIISGTGTHMVSADCLSSPTAEGSYMHYDGAIVTVPTTSVGYWLAAQSQQFADGFGDAPDLTPMAILPPSASRIVGVAGNPATGLGYWTAGSDGGVFSNGDVNFYGSAGALKLRAPIVGIASTMTGHGYWLVASDGGVFTFGDAYFAGSGVGAADPSPVVGLVPYGFHTGRGYLLAHADGEVVQYGPAGVSVANGALWLNAPVVGIAVTPSEAGYYLVAADGGVFTFGDAQFAGSLGGIRLAAPVTGIDARFDGGYYVVAADGGVFAFGGAPFFGSDAPRRGTAGRIGGIAATPDPLSPRR
jgi:hypothetical protein